MSICNKNLPAFCRYIYWEWVKAKYTLGKNLYARCHVGIVYFESVDFGPNQGHLKRLVTFTKDHRSHKPTLKITHGWIKANSTGEINDRNDYWMAVILKVVWVKMVTNAAFYHKEILMWTALVQLIILMFAMLNPRGRILKAKNDSLVCKNKGEIFL